MGTRVLVGEYDGTTPGAVMVDSTSGWPVGPIFEGVDALEQVEAFQEWLRGMPYIRLHDEGLLVFDPSDLYDPTVGDGMDPREWPTPGLAKLVSYWRAGHVGDDGWMKETP